MHFINSLLLSVTFVASIALLVIMQQRGLIRRLRLFFVLLLLYVLRSAVLMIGLRLFDRSTYMQVASALSLLDFGLQLALAYSLARNFSRVRPGAEGEAGGGILNSALAQFASAVFLAAALTLGLVTAFPMHSPVPLDRGVLLSGFVFLLLLVFVRNRSASAPEACVLVGFCVVSAANILAQYGRSAAAVQHQPGLFLAWSYGNIAIWVGVLVFWIFRLRAGSVSAGSYMPWHATATLSQ